MDEHDEQGVPFPEVGAEPAEPVAAPQDLRALREDDLLLDRIGHGDHGIAGPHADLVSHALTRWRTSLQPDDLPAPPAIPAVRRPRALPRVLAVAAAVAVLLVGTAVAGSRTAGPDDMLWPLTQMLWSDRVDSVAARDNAVAAMGAARTAIQTGDLPRASAALTGAAGELAKVQDRDGRQDLDADYQQMWQEIEHLLVTTPSTAPAPATSSSSSTPSARPPATTPTTGPSGTSGPVSSTSSPTGSPPGPSTSPSTSAPGTTTSAPVTTTSPDPSTSGPAESTATPTSPSPPASSTEPPTTESESTTATTETSTTTSTTGSVAPQTVDPHAKTSPPAEDTTGTSSDQTQPEATPSS